MDILVVFTLIKLRQKKQQRPEVLGTTVEASNQRPLNEVTIMADTQSNQTRLKFTFLIVSGTERLAGMSSLIFVSRQGAYHE
ncbi:hypothetical protein PSI19_15350 [Xenorhabdus khoisanae]|uniref:hypothetical protein n=1 Tax=Xenorhabdus khoisanae TaxID=880157 RepID=UPI0023599EE5|nr:hypothetical protein [Xenorhabdus khoisanae]MDC9615217.1 hypothetical protein [Xenorhabdus khoisanae]